MKVVVVGAGAAGVFAAIQIKERNANIDVTLLESSKRALRKVKISGGSRCNVTHHCFEPKELVQSYPRGKRELLGVFNRFQPRDTVAWFESRGVRLKTEGDGRMFPSTDDSQTIIDCLLGRASEVGVKLLYQITVNKILKSQRTFEISTSSGALNADQILLATGSSEMGFALAASLGQPLIERVPSLFTFVIRDKSLTDLSGVSAKAISLKLVVGSKSFLQTGPLLITHWGVSGPAVLRLSAFAARELFNAEYKGKLFVNWVGEVSGEIESVLQSQAAKKVVDPLGGVSKRLWNRLLLKAQIDPTKNWADVSKKVRARFQELLVGEELSVEGKGQFKEEFVSCGGVALKHIDMRTMQSKIIDGLFFAGEILDIDGVTGGFNFQNAWSTAAIAATAIAQNN